MTNKGGHLAGGLSNLMSPRGNQRMQVHTPFKTLQVSKLELLPACSNDGHNVHSEWMLCNKGIHEFTPSFNSCISPYNSNLTLKLDPKKSMCIESTWINLFIGFEAVGWRVEAFSEVNVDSIGCLTPSPLRALKEFPLQGGLESHLGMTRVACILIACGKNLRTSPRIASKCLHHHLLYIFLGSNSTNWDIDQKKALKLSSSQNQRIPFGDTCEQLWSSMLKANMSIDVDRTLLGPFCRCTCVQMTSMATLPGSLYRPKSKKNTPTDPTVIIGSVYVCIYAPGVGMLLHLLCAFICDRSNSIFATTEGCEDFSLAQPYNEYQPVNASDGFWKGWVIAKRCQQLDMTPARLWIAQQFDLKWKLMLK